MPRRKLPLWLSIPTAVSDTFPVLRPKLQPEALMRAAAKRANLPPVFPEHVREGLSVLCRSLEEEVRLNFLGERNYHFLLTSGLAELLLLEDAFRKHPELDRTPLNAPIFVVGLPRSGTTFLHRLLSASPDTTAMPLYRHIRPVGNTFPPPLAETELIYYPFRLAGRSYGMDSMHFVRPKLADECNFSMRLGMHTMIYFSLSPTLRFLDWLLAQRIDATYGIYRRVLQLHALRNPGKRLVLKCPYHVAFLPALRRVFPEAFIVNTHRDPAQTVASDTKLILSLQSLHVKELDWQRSAEAIYEKDKRSTERILAYARETDDERLIHVKYRQLVSDPITLAGDIYERVGLNASPASRKAISAYYSGNRQHKYGKNEYSLQQFGWNEAMIARDFGAYRERFVN